MDVTWLGHGCFRLRGKSAAVITDPYPPAIGLRLPGREADLLTISHDHDNHAYAQAVREGAYEIKGPGEYEVAGGGIIGIATYHDSEKGTESGCHTVYRSDIVGVGFGPLGD